MITIKSFANVHFDTVFEAFSKAFSDYDIQLSKTELNAMLHRRGYVPELSFGAFEEDRIVAFTLNGIGSFRGNRTAYDTGTGTLTTHRGQGLATKVFRYSIPFLKKAEISHYLLEVLQHNTKAVSVYQNLGFTTSREFHYFVQKTDQLQVREQALPDTYRIKQMNVSELNPLSRFWDFYPSWQNSFEAISRKPDDFKILGAFQNQEPVAYCVFEPNSGDLTQLAVDAKHRRKGIASNLLKEVVKWNRHDSVKLINAEIACTSVTEFLNSCSIPVQGKQFEMIKTL